MERILDAKRAEEELISETVTPDIVAKAAEVVKLTSALSPRPAEFTA